MSLYTDRINECYKCDKAEKKLLSLHCKVCGCNMKIKARMKDAKCPLDKWKEQGAAGTGLEPVFPSMVSSHTIGREPT